MTKPQNTSSADEQPHLARDIIAQIKDKYSGLSQAERQVADAVLSDVNAAVAASNAEIAKKAGVSEPSVTRFCRSVGCTGVRDFKLRLARSLVVGELFLTVDQTPVIADSDSVPPFWGSVFNEARKALREVEVQLNPALLNTAGASISKARRVIVLGLGGSSSTLAEEVQVRLFRYGVSVIACKDPYLARMSISTLRSDDVFIAISATGRAREILDCVDLANHYGVTSIGITAPDSALANAAEIALTTRISEYPDALTPSASRFAFLMIIDLLAAATGYAMGPEARENLRRIKFNLVSERTGVGLEPLGE